MQVTRARAEYVRWLLVTKDLSPHTIRAYDGDIAAFASYLGETAAVALIDRDQLMGFMEAQRGAGLAAASLRRRAAGLRGFVRWLRTRQLLSEDDPWGETTIATGRSRRLPRLLSRHDLSQLIAGAQELSAFFGGDTKEVLAKPHASTTLLAVGLMVTTGMRVGEAVAIDCGDLDLPSRSLRIVGKGRRERQVYLTNA